MDSRLNVPWLALRLGIGLTATLAGLDKFFNLLTNWSQYVSPLAVQMLPFSMACGFASRSIMVVAGAWILAMLK